MKTPTIAIVSGGLDSTVLAYWVHQGKKRSLTGIVSVDYGQSHRRELSFATLTAQRLGVRHHLLDLSSLKPHIGSSSLTGGGPIPHGHYAAESMRSTVVPNRNMVLLSLAVSVAIANGAKSVVYGAHNGDHDVYPDCRKIFVDALQATVALCDYDPPLLEAPFVDKSKADIVRLGNELGVPFGETQTCYEGGVKACGRCGTCVERLEAFALAGIEDPLEYVDREFWVSATETHRNGGSEPQLL
jgi:7-cyano-7-deazaguanine synthase